MSNLIIDIEGVDFSKANITYVNGMTIEKIRLHYNWILNAKVKDVIIGEDEYGLVWYFGDWYCGEWLDGTWYSGNFYQGNWNNGKWFSYKLNKFDVVNEKIIVENTYKNNSIFHNGIWLNGIWNNGIFGVSATTQNWEGYELYTYLNTDYLDIIVSNFKSGTTEKDVATWLDGNWVDGLFINSIWDNGIVQNIEFKNSMWVDGSFYDGIFDGDTWFNGDWYNGEFIRGKWLNGVFTKLDENKLSRFGTSKNNSLETVCEWFNGEWKNGEWFSGIQEVNGEYFSINNKISIWYDGIWRNGIWYGGHFKGGEWYNGIWKDGIFGNIETEELSPNYVYEGRIPLSGSSTIYDNISSYWSGSTSIINTGNTLINGASSETYDLKYIENEYDNLVVTADTALTDTIYIREEYDVHVFGNLKHRVRMLDTFDEVTLTELSASTPISDISSSTSLSREIGIVDYSILFNNAYLQFTNISSDTINYPQFDFWIKINQELNSRKNIIFQSDDFIIQFFYTHGHIKLQIIKNTILIYDDVVDFLELKKWYHFKINNFIISPFIFAYEVVIHDIEILLYNYTENVSIKSFTMNSGATISHPTSGLSNINIENFSIKETQMEFELFTNSYYNDINFINEKRNFELELQPNTKIKINDDYYEISAVTYEPYKYFSNGVDFLNYSWSKVKLKTNISLNSWGNNDISFKYKEPINIEYGDGDNYTYYGSRFDYDFNYSTYATELDTNSYLSIISPIFLQKFKNDYVYVSEFNKVFKIINYGSISSSYYITIKKYNNLEDSPCYLLDSYLWKQKQKDFETKSLIFHGFDFNLNNIINRVNGIGVSISKETTPIVDNIHFSPNPSGLFKDKTIGLPLKHLDYLTTYDFPYYDSRYGSPIENSSKYIDEEIINNSCVYGSMDDLWNLETLSSFYSGDTDYDITLPTTIQNLRIETSFNLDVVNTEPSINKFLTITQPKLKIYYTTLTSATWYDGDFEKGLWLNGTFKDGNMYSSNIIYCDFEKGYFGYENNIKRQINPDINLALKNNISHF